jgi:hypothetical protein
MRLCCNVHFTIDKILVKRAHNIKIPTTKTKVTTLKVKFQVRNETVVDNEYIREDIPLEVSRTVAQLGGRREAIRKN